MSPSPGSWHRGDGSTGTLWGLTRRAKTLAVWLEVWQTRRQMGEVQLTDQQRARALEALQEYLSAPAGKEGKTPVQEDVELDQKRATLIEQELKPLLSGY